jgi:hypothetical protein
MFLEKSFIFLKLIIKENELRLSLNEKFNIVLNR